MKLLIYIALFYLAYQLFIGSRIESPSSKDKDHDDEYIDYEELD